MKITKTDDKELNIRKLEIMCAKKRIGSNLNKRHESFEAMYTFVLFAFLAAFFFFSEDGAPFRAAHCLAMQFTSDELKWKKIIKNGELKAQTIKKERVSR